MTEEFKPYAGNLSKAHTELNNAREANDNAHIQSLDKAQLRVAIAFVHCWIELAAQVRVYVNHITSLR